jgi:hypothetical protein
VIGEDCHVYTTLNNRVFAFAPLPIQDIVPIFECVNQDGVAYFSYKNLMDHAFAIPQLFDRNNLSPLVRTLSFFSEISSFHHFLFSERHSWSRL